MPALCCGCGHTHSPPTTLGGAYRNSPSFFSLSFSFLFITPMYSCEEVALMGERLGVWALEQGGRTSANALALLGVVALFADPAGVCILTPTDYRPALA